MRRDLLSAFDSFFRSGENLASLTWLFLAAGACFSACQPLGESQIDPAFHPGIRAGPSASVSLPPASIAVSQNNNQTRTAGLTLSNPLQAIVRDAANQPVSGVSVTWAVASGGGSVSTCSGSTTNASGIASCAPRLGSVAGTNTFTANYPGGTPATFTATGTSAAFTSSWVLNSGTNFSLSDSTTLRFSGGACELTPSSQTDQTNAATQFGGGTLNGVAWSSATDGLGTSNYLMLSQSGSATDLELSPTWTPKWSNLKGYWKLNGTPGSPVQTGSAAIPATVGSNGTPFGSSASYTLRYVAGKFGQAIQFDGTTGYITVPNGSHGHYLDSNGFTLSFWVKRDRPLLGLTEIVMGSECQGDWQMGFDANDHLFVSDGFGHNYASTSGITDSQWHQVAMTYDGTNTGIINFYIDGQPDPSNNSGPYWTYWFSFNACTFDIGQSVAMGGNFFLGSIDELAFWNHSFISATSPLSDPQVLDVFNFGAPVTSSNVDLVDLSYYLPLDGTLGGISSTDSIPENIVGNNGTPQGVPLVGQYSAAKINQGITFDGNSTSISVSPAPNVNNPLTVMAWVNPSQLSQSGFSGGTGGTIVEGNETNNTSGWVFGVADTQYLWFWPSDSNDIYSVGKVPLRQWSHVAATYDGTSLSLYINGALDSTQAMPPPQALTFLKIGAKGWTTGYWNGILDEVAVWDTALSPSAIATIYQHQLALKAGTFQSRVMDSFSAGPSWTTLGWTPTLPFLKELPYSGSSETAANYPSQSANLMNGLVALWHFDETSGTTVRDASGNSNTGTIQGGVTLGVSGILSNSAALDGSTGYISIPGANFRNLTSGTIAAWFFVNAGFGVGEIISTLTDQSSNRQFAMQVTEANLGYFTIDTAAVRQNGAIPFIVVSSNTFPTGQWHHIAYTSTQGSGTHHYYMDGIEQSMIATQGAVTDFFYANTMSATDDLQIGAKSDGQFIHRAYFPGRIDELAIWNRALQPDEIMRLYRRGANRIRHQIRTCPDSTCSTNPSWVGPDGSDQTFFTELNNNAVQSRGGAVQPGDTVLTGLPLMAFSNFAGLPAALGTNRYFQYRTILESDDSGTGCDYGSGATWCSPELQQVSVGPTHYDSSAPTVTSTIGMDYAALSNFVQTASCASGVFYNLSPDGTTWYYHVGGGVWGIAGGTAATATSAAAVAANIAAFASQLGAGTLYFRAFLQSSGTSTCLLSTIQVTGLQ